MPKLNFRLSNTPTPPLVHPNAGSSGPIGEARETVAGRRATRYSAFYQATRTSLKAPRRSSRRAQKDFGGLFACPDGLDAALDERLNARAVQQGEQLLGRRVRFLVPCPRCDFAELGSDPSLVRAHERVHWPLAKGRLHSNIGECAAPKTGIRCELLGHFEDRLDGIGSRSRPLKALREQGPSRLRLTFESGESKGLLGGEVVVECHAGDAGVFRHLVYANIGQAALIKEVRRRIDQAVAWRRSGRHQDLLI